MGYQKFTQKSFIHPYIFSQKTRQQIYEKKIIINDLVLQAWAISYN